MRFSTSLFLAAAPLLVSAAPARIYGRAVAATDILVFKFADVLEQLESSFYTQAIAKFQDADFVSAGFSPSTLAVEQFSTILTDETTHSSVIQSALKSAGAEPITSCKFNFDSVLTDVATMAATARVVENVGVAAYLGGATLISDPVLLDAAASILTVEARHQTILNVLSSTGTAIPSAFDIALTPSEVIALAGGFFDGACDLGLPANPALAITNTGTVAPGTLLTFSASTINGTISADKLFCQMLIGGAPFSISLPLSQCVVPSGINGPVAIWVTSDSQPLINNVRDRATTQLVAGPAMAFIDTAPQALGQLVRGGSVNSSGSTPSTSTTVSTATLSPAEASAAIASASSAVATGGATGSSVVATVGATGTAASSAASSTATAAATPANNASAGGPNTFVGLSPDGHVTVNGWKNLSGS